MIIRRMLKLWKAKLRNSLVNKMRNYKEKKVRRHELNECREIIATINDIKPFNSALKKEIKYYYSNFTKDKILTDWHLLYTSSNGNFDVRYIPIDILFNKIIPFLNDIRFTEAYADKSQYEKLFPDILHPVTIIKKIKGAYYLNDMIVSEEKALLSLPKTGLFIVKPTIDTSQGKGVDLLDLEAYKTVEDVRQCMRKFGNNFIIQEKIKAHPLISSLNPSSLNTLRLITYRNDSEVKIVSVTLKIGKKGEIVDNGHFGGYFCGVSDNGKLGSYLYTLNPFTKNKETENGIRIDGIQIPNFEEIKRSVRCCALRLPYARYVGWDIAVNREGLPVLIEINLKCPGGNIMQIPNGPLFGEFTDQILREVFNIAEDSV